MIESSKRTILGAHGIQRQDDAVRCNSGLRAAATTVAEQFSGPTLKASEIVNAGLFAILRDPGVIDEWRIIRKRFDDRESSAMFRIEAEDLGIGDFANLLIKGDDPQAGTAAVARWKERGCEPLAMSRVESRSPRVDLESVLAQVESIGSVADAIQRLHKCADRLHDGALKSWVNRHLAQIEDRLDTEA